MEEASNLPEVSVTTLSLAGILVDVYGLDQLIDPGTVTCLWLLHPRLYARQHMRSFAHLAVGSWLSQGKDIKHGRGLLALAFDLPNHGSRLVNETYNREFVDGNDQHAINMVHTIRNGRTDLSKLIVELEDILEGGKIENHIALGWSLGGHVVWQAWLWEPKIDSAVIIVGCPDIPGLMQSRARKSKVQWSGPFQGSRIFPSDVSKICMYSDPKTYLFGRDALEKITLSSNDECRLWTVLNHTIKGKKLLLCSGEEDELVPYAITQPFVHQLSCAVSRQNWQGEDAVAIDDRLYGGMGHEFSNDMVKDAVEWIMDASRAGRRREQGNISTHRNGPSL